MNDKTMKLALELQKRKEQKEQVKSKYKNLNKVKKLTQEHRIARIEEILGIYEGDS